MLQCVHVFSYRYTYIPKHTHIYIQHKFEEEKKSTKIVYLKNNIERRKKNNGKKIKEKYEMCNGKNGKGK